MATAEILDTEIDPWGQFMLDDPLMSNGTLFLFDPSHSRGSFDGNPVNGQVLPNIAWQQAADIIGSGDATSLGALCSIGAVTGTITENTHYKLERTGKGGIHFLPTQAGPLSNGGPHLKVAPMSPIIAYMLANPTHHFYVSMWMRQTRRTTIASTQQSPMVAAQSTSSYFWRGDNGSYFTQGTAFLGDRDQIGVTGSADFTDDPVWMNVATQAYYGTVPATLDLAFGLGAFGPLHRGANDDAPFAGVLYRGFIEDMTVSGRTWAQINELEGALFNELFGTGGRLADDTYLDPATFA